MNYLMYSDQRHLPDLVVRELVKGPATRQELSERLDVSRTSLGRAISELLSNGPVLKTQNEHRSGPGRPVQQLCLDTTVAYSVGIDVSRSRCYAVVLNRSYDIIAQAHLLIENFTSWRQPLTDICNAIYQAGIEAGASMSHISKVGIGIPVPINHNSPEFVTQKCEIKEVVEKFWNASALIENNVRLAAIGEAGWGASKNYAGSLLIRLSAGIGCCSTLFDQITDTWASAVGEFGHITVNPLGEKCHCGRRGCLETYVSSNALCQKAKVSNLQELQKAYKQKNILAQQTISVTARLIGQALSTVIILTNPEIIVFSGDVIEYIPELLSLIENAVAKELPIQFRRNLIMVQAELDGIGAALGAARATDLAKFRQNRIGEETSDRK